MREARDGRDDQTGGGLVTAAEIAAALRVTSGTVRRWAREDSLPAIGIRRPGARTLWRFDPAQLAGMLAGGED